MKFGKIVVKSTKIWDAMKLRLRQLEEENKTISDKASGLEKQLHVAGINPDADSNSYTENEMALTRIYRYRDRVIDKGEDREAELLRALDTYFKEFKKGEEHPRAHIYGGNSTKLVVLPEKKSQQGVLSRVEVIKRHESADIAAFESAIADAYRAKHSHFGPYYFEEEVQGADGHELFIYLNEEIKKGNSFAQQLKERLLSKSLDLLVTSQTTSPSVPEDIAIFAQAEEKFVAAFSHHVALDTAARKKLATFGSALDAQSSISFHDYGLWNLRAWYVKILDYVNTSGGGELANLSDKYERRGVNNYAIHHRLVSGAEKGDFDPERVISAFTFNLDKIDHENARRYTFPADDLIHILESPGALLTPEEVSEKESYFLDKLVEQGVDVEHYQSFRHLASAYRHARFFSLYECGKMREDLGNYRDFHLHNAYCSLYRHLNGRMPSAESLETVTNLKPVLDLVLQTDI